MFYAGRFEFCLRAESSSARSGTEITESLGDCSELYENVTILGERSAYLREFGHFPVRPILVPDLAL